jgi:TonB family protein
VAGAALAAVLAALAAAWLYWHFHYFAASEVDRPAFPLQAIDLPYPKGAGGVDYYGSLKLELYIDAQGEVTRVALIDTSVPRPYEEVALRHFRAARFGPALKWGRPVRSRKKIEVRFTPPVDDRAPFRRAPSSSKSLGAAGS